MFYCNKHELKTKYFSGLPDSFLKRGKRKEEQERIYQWEIEEEKRYRQWECEFDEEMKKETMSILKNRSICKKTENFIATYVLVLNNKFPCFMYPETKITIMKFSIDAQKTHTSTMTVTVHDIMPIGECTEMGSCVFSGTYNYITVKIILSFDFNNHNSIFMEDAREFLINCKDCLIKNKIDSYILDNPLPEVEFEMNSADVARLNAGLSKLTIPVLSSSFWLKYVK